MTEAAGTPGAGNAERPAGLSRARAADQNQIALAAQELAAGKITQQGLVDRCSIGGELLYIPDKEQPPDGSGTPCPMGLSQCRR